MENFFLVLDFQRVNSTIFYSFDINQCLFFIDIMSLVFNRDIYKKSQFIFYIFSVNLNQNVLDV